MDEREIKEKLLNEKFANELLDILNNMQDLDPEFSQIVNDYFWEMLE